MKATPKLTFCNKLSDFFNEEHERRNMVFSCIGPGHPIKALVIQDREDSRAMAARIQKDFPGCQISFMPEAEFNGDFQCKEGDQWLVCVFRCENGVPVECRWLLGHYSVKEADFMRKGESPDRFLCWVPPGEMKKEPDAFVDDLFTPEEIQKLGLAPGTLLTNRVSYGPPREDPWLKWVLSGPNEEKKIS